MNKYYLLQLLLSSLVAGTAMLHCHMLSSGQLPTDQRVLELADENETTIGLIRSANVTLTAKVANFDSDSPTFRRNYRELHWTKRGDHERLVIHRTSPAVGEGAGGASQVLAADTTIFLEKDCSKKLFWYYDKRVLSGSTVGSARDIIGGGAYQAPLSRWHPDFEFHYLVCQQFYLTPIDDARTFREVVRECPTEYRGTTEIDGAACDVVRALHPGVPPAGETAVEFYLDQHAGAMIRKIVVYQPIGQLVKEVKKFYTGANGVFFPLECEGGFRAKDPQLANKTPVTSVHVTSCSINDELPESEVHIPFPEGTAITIFNSPLTPGSTASDTDVGIVGGNGQIIRRFKVNSEEWKQYQESAPRAGSSAGDPGEEHPPLIAEASTRGSGLLVACTVLLGCGAALMIVLLLHGRQSMKRTIHRKTVLPQLDIER